MSNATGSWSNLRMPARQKSKHCKNMSESCFSCVWSNLTPVRCLNLHSKYRLMASRFRRDLPSLFDFHDPVSIARSVRVNHGHGNQGACWCCQGVWTQGTSGSCFGGNRSMLSLHTSDLSRRSNLTTPWRPSHHISHMNEEPKTLTFLSLVACLSARSLRQRSVFSIKNRMQG